MAAVTVYSAPDDEQKGRPKHVEHTCSCLINTTLPELHLVGLLYIRVVGKLETHILRPTTFFYKNRAVYKIMWKNVVQPGRP